MSQRARRSAGTAPGAAPAPAADLLTEILARALSRGGEYGDLFVEERHSLSVSIEEGRVENPVWGHDAGAGIRVIREGITQHVFTDDLGEGGLRGAVDALLAGSGGAAVHVPTVAPPAHLEETAAPLWADAVSGIALLRAADLAARRADASIVQVRASFAPSRRRIQVLSSRGGHAEEVRSQAVFRVRAWARRGDATAEGVAGVGASGAGLGEDAAAALGARAAASAVRLLDAVPAPAGELPVILTSGWGGVLFHEACGHGLEADFVQRGSSWLAGRRGRRVAAESVTVIDDPTLPGLRGSYGIDDEGTPGAPTVLIERGVLRGYLYDVARALRDGAASTGNGRRQSYRDLPIPRMSNTYLAPGPFDSEEIVENTPRGIYVANLGGGTVDLASGDFVFSVTEGYMVEDGKIRRPIRGATLVGRAPRLLLEIDMIGNDLAHDPGYGACGKEGQLVPVCVGQPTVRVPRMIVGGTALAAEEPA